MVPKALKSRTGEKLSWREAIIRSLTEMGHPASAREIFDYMQEHVIEHVPEKAKTPLSTISMELTTHTEGSGAKKKIYYKADDGKWGLVEGCIWTVQPERSEHLEINTSSRKTEQRTLHTLRQLFDAYMEENPSDFNENLREKMQKAVNSLRLVMDMQYDQITDRMLDEGIKNARNDLVRTELAFLIHEFDRETGCRHTLAYDTELPE